MISASLYTLVTLSNVALLPFYWYIHEDFRLINTLLNQEEFFFDFQQLQDYLLVCIVFTMTLVAIWLLFCISQRKVLHGFYVSVLLVSSIMGIVMVNELEYSHNLLENLFEEDDLTCEDLLEELDANKFTIYAFCQDSWVYILYYSFYGLMTFIACFILGIALREKREQVERESTSNIEEVEMDVEDQVFVVEEEAKN